MTELPICAKCGNPCNTSSTFGFFCCSNVKCEKYMLLQFDNPELWERMTQGIDEKGRFIIRSKTKKRINTKNIQMV